MRPSDAGRLLLLAGIWGASFLFIKLGLEGFTSMQIVFGRLAVGALMLLVLLFARGIRLPNDLAVWRSLILLGAFNNVAPFFLIAWGEQSIPSGLAAILNSTTPLFTALLAATLLPSEHLSPIRGAGILLGFAGVVVIVGVDTGGTLMGQLAVVLASLCYGAGLVYATLRLPPAARSPLQVSAGQLAAATLLSLPLVTASSVMDPPQFGVVPALCVAALGAFGTGIAYLLYFRLLNDVGPTSTSFVTYLVPILGVALGWALLGEHLGINALLGAALVIGGIALAERGPAILAHRREKRAALEQPRAT